MRQGAYIPKLQIKFIRDFGTLSFYTFDTLLKFVVATLRKTAVTMCQSVRYFFKSSVRRDEDISITVCII